MILGEHFPMVCWDKCQTATVHGIGDEGKSNQYEATVWAVAHLLPPYFEGSIIFYYS